MEEWSRWLREHRHELVSSVLPAFAYENVRLWTHLVEHGVVTHQGEVFDVSRLHPQDAAQLLTLLDSAPEPNSILAQEARFTLTRANTLVLEALLRFEDSTDAINDAPAEDDVRVVVGELPVRVEGAFDRLLVDRSAYVSLSLEPPGILLCFYSEVMSSPRAFDIAVLIAERLGVRTDRPIELVPLSWPDRFDDEMDERLEQRR